MLKLIYEYQKSVTNQVEVYNSRVMANKEHLEEMRIKLQRWWRNNHVTEQILQRETFEQLKDDILRASCERFVHEHRLLLVNRGTYLTIYI